MKVRVLAHHPVEGFRDIEVKEATSVESVVDIIESQGYSILNVTPKQNAKEEETENAS